MENNELVVESTVEGVKINLDYSCWNCRNSNRGWDGKNHSTPKTPETRKEDGTCSVCDGSGFLLTDAGEILKEFIKRHLEAK